MFAEREKCFYKIHPESDTNLSTLLCVGMLCMLWFLPFHCGLCCTIASVEIKDIWFLLPYLAEKFTDKEVSTLMIKPNLDLKTWAEPFSLQTRIRGSMTPSPIC